MWPLVTGGDQKKGLQVKGRSGGIENMARAPEQWLWQLLVLENQQCHVLAPVVMPMWDWWGNMRTGSRLWGRERKQLTLGKKPGGLGRDAVSCGTVVPTYTPHITPSTAGPRVL